MTNREQLKEELLKEIRAELEREKEACSETGRVLNPFQEAYLGEIKAETREIVAEAWEKDDFTGCTSYEEDMRYLDKSYKGYKENHGAWENKDANWTRHTLGYNALEFRYLLHELKK